MVRIFLPIERKWQHTSWQCWWEGYFISFIVTVLIVRGELGARRGESGRKWGMLSANWRIMSLYLSHIEIHCLWQTGLHLTVGYELAFCPIQSIIRPTFQYDFTKPLLVINGEHNLFFRVFIANYCKRYWKTQTIKK